MLPDQAARTTEPAESHGRHTHLGTYNVARIHHEKQT